MLHSEVNRPLTTEDRRFLGVLAVLLIQFLLVAALVGYVAHLNDRLQMEHQRILCMEASWGQDFIGGASSINSDGEITTSGCVEADRG